MSFAKDLFESVQMKMVQSIDEYERLEVRISLCLFHVSVLKVQKCMCMCVYDRFVCTLL